MLQAIQKKPSLYDDLESKAARLQQGLEQNLKASGIPGIVNRIGSMFTLFFTDLEKVTTYADVTTCDTDRFAKYFHLCLKSGINIAPSQFEAGFVSAAHSDEDIVLAIDANQKALAALAE
jgi:glutamate-1-semialdehyde 2,1-aminomutase